MTTVATAESSKLGTETRKLGASALVYLVSNIFMRGITFALTPLYTRAMEPRDFAVVSVTNSLIAVLSIVLGMALYGSVPRLYFEYKGDERRAFFGTLLGLSLVAPAVLVAGLYALGATGHLDLFENVRFDPHIKLVLWTSLCNVYMPLPLAAYISREEPRSAALLNIFGGVTQLAASLLFVAVLHGGALGVLHANLASSALVGGVSIVLMLRMSTITRGLPGWKTAVVYSLPLVPHLIANWALGISDRLVLDRYVSPADVGRYSLGYMFGLVVSMVAASVGNAMTPMAMRQLKEPSGGANVPPLGTYMVAFITAVAVPVALGAREVIGVIAPASYAGATVFVPWVVLGSVFQGIYLVWSIGTWFSMKTKLIPVVTAIGAALNVAINVVFVPRYGVLTAAVSTAIAYAASAGLHGLLAAYLHRIPWQYSRWARILAVGVACYFVGELIPEWNVWGALFVKLAFAAVAYPVGLVITGVVSASEFASLRGIVARRFAR